MRILGFDTATSATVVALVDSDAATTFERRDDPPRGERPRHTTRLMSFIADVLGEAGVSFTELDRIAVGVGPGTFTGLRIGVATARALGQASGLQTVGISTLESLALNAARRDNADAVCAVLDARRGEVFAAAWTLDGHEPLLDASALAPAALIPHLGSRTLAIGDGAIAFREVLERSGALIPGDESDLHRVTAVNHCRLGLLAHASGADRVLPNYLRLPDAELARRSSTNR